MTLNLDSYRMAHESDVEWGLRRKFLEAHQDKYTGNTNRLLCLASCFVNIEMYGCRYPNEVMIEVKELIEEIADEIQDFRQEIRKRTEVQFVKAEEPSSAARPGGKLYGNFVKSDDKVVKPSHSSNNDNKLVSGNSGSGIMSGFVKSEETLPSSTKTENAAAERKTMNLQSPEMLSPQLQAELDRFYTLASQLNMVRSTGNPGARNSTSALHMAADKLKMPIVPRFEENELGFVCNLQINHVDVAAGNPCAQKKATKSDAYDKAVTSLSKPYLYIKTVNPMKKELFASDYPFEGVSGGGLTKLGATRGANNQRNLPAKRGRKRPYDTNRSNSDDFYIVQPKYSRNHAASGILHQSKEFSKQPLDWEFSSELGMTHCNVCLRGSVIGRASNASRADAKKEASEAALDYLRERCWTFEIKQSADSDEAGISRTEILGDEAKKQEELPSSNIGNKMMKMMGWSGGGIGKNQQGIKEPINVSTVINRAGLGMLAEQGISKNFLPQIKTTIHEYARSDKEGDLVFSSDITKEERALIHSECKKLNLKSHSHGTGEERYLVVSRKRTARQLFNMLQQQGGESSKYLLIPPGESSQPYDD